MLKDDAALFAEFYAHLIRERVPKDAAAHITAVYMQTQLMRIAASEQGG